LVVLAVAVVALYLSGSASGGSKGARNPDSMRQQPETKSASPFVYGEGAHTRRFFPWLSLTNGGTMEFITGANVFTLPDHVQRTQHAESFVLS